MAVTFEVAVLAIESNAKDLLSVLLGMDVSCGVEHSKYRIPTAMHFCKRTL